MALCLVTLVLVKGRLLAIASVTAKLEKLLSWHYYQNMKVKVLAKHY